MVVGPDGGLVYLAKTPLHAAAECGSVAAVLRCVLYVYVCMGVLMYVCMGVSLCQGDTPPYSLSLTHIIPIHLQQLRPRVAGRRLGRAAQHTPALRHHARTRGRGPGDRA